MIPNFGNLFNNKFKRLAKILLAGIGGWPKYAILQQANQNRETNPTSSRWLLLYAHPVRGSDYVAGSG